MKPRHAPDRMSRLHNETAALSKVAIAPLHMLTDDRLQSIVNSHAAPRDRPKLFALLQQRLAERKEREAVRG